MMVEQQREQSQVVDMRVEVESQQLVCGVQTRMEMDDGKMEDGWV